MHTLALIFALAGISAAFAAEPPTDPILRVEAGVHVAAINALSITRDGRIITASDDKTARVWPASGGSTQVLRVPIGRGNEGALYAVAASPAKDSAVVGGWTGIAWDGAGAVYAFDLKAGKMTGRIAGLPGTVQSLAYSKDGRYLAIGTSAAPSLGVLDLAGRSVATDDRAYGDTVTSIAFLPDGRLVTAALDGKVRLYDAAFKSANTHQLPDKARPWRLAVAPEGDRIAVGSLDTGMVQILSADGLKPVAQLSGDSAKRGGFSSVAWTGTTVAAAGTYGDAQGAKYLHLWDLANGQEREALVAQDTVTDLAVTPDGKIAFATAEPSMGTVDIQTLAVLAHRRTIGDFRDAFQGVFAVAPDGSAVDISMVQGGRSPIRFDLTDRTLAHDPTPRADMTRPTVPGTVRNWRNARNTTVRGIPVALDENEYSRSAAAGPDGSTIVLGADYSLRFFRAGRQMWKVPLHAPAWAVNATKDGRYVLSALGDGTVRWYSAKEGSEVLALFITSDDRWIIWTPEGYFDHGDHAEGLVGYHVNRGRAADPSFVLSGQIHQNFYRPDLVALKLHGGDLSAATAKTGEAKTVVAKHVAPELKLLAWCVRGKCSEPAKGTRGNGEHTISVDAPEVALRVALVDRGSGTGKLVLRRNGATVATRGATVKSEGVARTEEETVALEPGDNKITITALDDKRGVDAGDAIRLIIRYEAVSANAPTLHILSIGINRYRNPDVPVLANAANDAKGMAETVANLRAGLFKEARAIVLTEQQATLENIKKAFKQVAAEAKPDDVVLVFLAGHGVAIDGRYYFLPFDVAEPTPEAIKKTGLGQSVLAELLSSLPTARAAVLIDTCYAGAFAVPDAVMRQSQDRTWAGALAFNTGRFVLAGTTNQQEALDGINGHGVFTSVILDGLRGVADKEGKGNKDGRVDVVELSRYAEQRVPEEAHKLDAEHRQKATGFFAGSDFFELSVDAP